MIKIKKKKILNKKIKSGFTLIEILVGVALIVIVFLGILGSYQLAIRVVGQSKARVVALSLANKEIESIRNLPYNDIYSKNYSTTSNGINFNVQVVVEDYDDCADARYLEGQWVDCQGNATSADSVIPDYKKAKIRVSWVKGVSKNIVITSNISPKGVETGEGKGGLGILILNASGQKEEIGTEDRFPPCSSTTIHILNNPLGFDMCYGDENPGYRFLILDKSQCSEDYHIDIQKENYSEDKTYGSGEIYKYKNYDSGEVFASSTIIIPLSDKRHPTISEGSIYNITFFIDKLSGFLVKTFSPWGMGTFSDAFSNTDKISEIENLVISDGRAGLATSTEGYLASGFLISNAISPSNLIKWNEFSWSDQEPLNTNLDYQIFYATDTAWQLIPNSDLPGNSDGFIEPPIDLSDLDISKYFKLKLKVNASTSDPLQTPLLDDWQISWKNSEPVLIPNVKFSLKETEKIIGHTSDDKPIYKIWTKTSTDVSGSKQLSNLEWGKYNFFDFEKSGYELNLNLGLSPSMPVYLSPATTTQLNLYLESSNALLTEVKDKDSGLPIFGANVTLSNAGFSFNESHVSDANGKTLFIPLESSSSYELKVEAENYYTASTTLGIFGNTAKSISLERYE
ncbi:MAG: prepilin-type N-terminal cleavage/methylation domain-containing protein [Patescibacteria group bacterium]|nr:prepilin-type N-terminal cleavage/methylation domain-containing protein [Patescibacteria group bacterium]